MKKSLKELFKTYGEEVVVGMILEQLKLLAYSENEEEDKNRLITYLKELVQEYELEIEEYKAKANKYPFTSKEAKRYISKFKKAQTLKRRAIRNIEIFSEGVK